RENQCREDPAPLGLGSGGPVILNPAPCLTGDLSTGLQGTAQARGRVRGLTSFTGANREESALGTERREEYATSGGVCDKRKNPAGNVPPAGRGGDLSHGTFVSR